MFCRKKMCSFLVQLFVVGYMTSSHPPTTFPSLPPSLLLYPFSTPPSLNTFPLPSIPSFPSFSPSSVPYSLPLPPPLPPCLPVQLVNIDIHVVIRLENEFRVIAEFRHPPWKEKN